MPRHNYEVALYRNHGPTVKQPVNLVRVARGECKSLRSAQRQAAAWRRIAQPGSVWPYPRMTIARDGVMIHDWRLVWDRPHRGKIFVDVIKHPAMLEAIS